MRDMKKVIFGIVVLLCGIVILLNAFDITDIDIFFPGWWTLFIIIPCGVGLVTEREKTGNLVGLLVGVGLLLWQLDILPIDLAWKILVPAIVIVIGIKMIVRGMRRGDRAKVVKLSVDAPYGTAIFGGKELNFDGQVFEGCELTAIFGGVDCDLSGAIIEKDCTVKATAIFGGVDIIMPRGVNVKVNSTSIFGGTDDNSEKSPDAPVTLYVETVSIFGGVELK